MGSVKWVCSTCVKKCPECEKPCVDKETRKQKGLCFDCYSWTFGDEKWNNNYKGVVNAAACGDREACSILFRNAPFVTTGKFSGERITHIPDIDLAGVIRNTHPEMEKLGLVIKKCRKM